MVTMVFFWRKHKTMSSGFMLNEWDTIKRLMISGTLIQLDTIDKTKLYHRKIKCIWFFIFQWMQVGGARRRACGRWRQTTTTAWREPENRWIAVTCSSSSEASLDRVQPGGHKWHLPLYLSRRYADVNYKKKWAALFYKVWWVLKRLCN